MNRREIANIVALRVGLSGERVDEIIAETFRTILDEMSRESVVIRGFGTWSFAIKAWGQRWDPKKKMYVMSNGANGIRPKFKWARSISLFWQTYDRSGNSQYRKVPKINIER